MKRYAAFLGPLALLAVAYAIWTYPSGPKPNAACCVTNVPAAVFTDKSIYQLDSTWTNDVGQSLQLGQLQGRVQVVVMFFASCTYACPIIVQNMKDIESALPESIRARVGFTLVTMDTERDTPESLHAYRAARQLPADRWTLLRGTPDDTLELAALLGVKFKREASGQFAHSNLITVLNDKGEIIRQTAGLNQDIQETLKRIELAATEARP